MKIKMRALTYEDILLIPQYSDILPKQTNVSTRLTKKISMNIPIISAAMDSVSEHQMGIMMARLGGIGIIHKNMSIKEQKKEINLVKKSESGVIFDPIFAHLEDSLLSAKKTMDTYRISGVPIIDKDKKLIGILTNRDLRFETNFKKEIKDVMTSENLITAKIGTSLEEAKAILHKYKIEKLPLVDKNGKLEGLITIKDINKKQDFPNANVDDLGRLRVGAAVSVNDMNRVMALCEAGVDVLVLDSAHGHSKGIINALKEIKSSFDVEVIAGNIATKEGAKALCEAGADAIKVGIGPGSICTTRVISGIGVPQATAVDICVKVANEYNVPVIADGGIKYSGDIAKALAIGASSIMAGSILAGTKESPGDLISFQGRQYKMYRGMGSIGAMKKGSSDRYFQEESSHDKLVPEGIEGRVPYRGKIADIIFQLVGGVRASMGYTGSKNLKEFVEKAEFTEITSSGLRESHVHDVIITEEAPNYGA
jgi:IMP dehydrogenase